ncbi:MAG: hypothetical protein AAF488_08755 [Planctomycetota bacterium]
MRFLVLSTLVGLATVGCQTHPFADHRDDVAAEAMREYVERGEEAVPELVSLAESNDLLVRSRAHRTLGKITGQWGSHGDGIYWKRSVEEAKGGDRPLIVLHLFGNFDEEFC